MPVYLSVLMTTLVALPAAATMFLASYVLTIYVDFYRVQGGDRVPTDPRDPEWIGAWWTGYLLIGTLNFLVGIPMFFFPKRLPPPEGKKTTNDEKEQKDGNKRAMMTSKDDNDKDDDNIVRQQQSQASPQPPFSPSSSSSPAALFDRLFKNALFVSLSLVSCLRFSGITVVSVFVTKFCEDLFRGSPSRINMLRALILPMTAVAFLLSGFVTRLMPSLARAIKISCGFQVFSAAIAVGLFFLDCRLPEMRVETSCGGIDVDDVTAITTASCGNQPAFVCGVDGVEYWNPCVAGCVNADVIGKMTNYSNCACIVVVTDATTFSSSTTSSYLLGGATSGLCQTDCDQWILVTLIVLLGTQFFEVLAETTINVSFLRAVDPKDKTFALGLRKAVDDVFGGILTPVFVGALFDSTCVVWGGGGGGGGEGVAVENDEKDEQGTGSCALYDRHRYHLVFVVYIIVVKCMAVLVFSVIVTLSHAREEKETKAQQAEMEMGENADQINGEYNVQRASNTFVAARATTSADYDENGNERRVSDLSVSFLPSSSGGAVRGTGRRASKSHQLESGGVGSEGAEGPWRRKSSNMRRPSEVDLAQSVSAISLNKC